MLDALAIYDHCSNYNLEGTAITINVFGTRRDNITNMTKVLYASYIYIYIVFYGKSIWFNICPNAIEQCHERHRK